MRSSLRLALVRLLIYFIAGIVLYGLITPVREKLLLPPLFILCTLTGLFGFVFHNYLAYSCRWIPGVLVALFYVLSGYLLAFAGNPGNHPLNLIHRKDPVGFCVGTVTEPPRPGKRSIRFTLSLICVMGDRQFTRAGGKIIVYGKKDEHFPGLNYGDTLMIKTGIFPVSGPMNPGQFDYRKYLARNGIYHQAYLTAGNFHVLGPCKKWTVKRMAFMVHQRLAGILDESGLGERERATARALLLGDKSRIDEETYQAYSSSGTIHILCVSGLHVGVIYMILDFLLGFLSGSKAVKWGRYLLIILLIWFYAFLTGLSPSVLRATVMFTILIMGRAIRRSTNIYNTLASSALLLLSANTSMLLDTGFQLSYLAVIGIVTLQPWIRDLLPVKGWLLKKIWELMSVSLAAQLMTMPLTIFLFHQFPNYFLIANVLVVPLSGFIIYAGILLFATYPVPFLWKMICWIFGMMVKGMNEIVTFIEQLPYSTLTGLPLDAAGMVMLYVIILAATCLLVFRMKRALYVVLAAMTLLSGYKFYMSQRMNGQKELIIYSIPGSTAIGLFLERRGVFILDSALYDDPSRINMQFKGHWVKRCIKGPQLVSLSVPVSHEIPFIRDYHKEHLSLFQLEDESIMLIGSRLNLKQMEDAPFRVNYLLLRNNAPVSLKELIRVIDAECIISDMSSPRWRVKKWKEEAEGAGVCFYDTSEKGAFVKRWK
jgi:competence protein ComEC